MSSEETANYKDSLRVLANLGEYIYRWLEVQPSIWHRHRSFCFIGLNIMYVCMYVCMCVPRSIHRYLPSINKSSQALILDCRVIYRDIILYARFTHDAPVERAKMHLCLLLKLFLKKPECTRYILQAIDYLLTQSLKLTTKQNEFHSAVWCS